jgi:hypothetical protein
VLLVPVLVEAQGGRQPTTTAGRCPLRGMQTATVVSSATPGMRLGAAAALLTGAAGLVDKTADGDLPRVLNPAASLLARRFRRDGVRLAGQLGLEVQPVVDAAAAATALESQPASLDELLAPSGRAVAGVFGHTAVVAGTPDNVGALRQVGDAYGRLVHLLDAVDDEAGDARRGCFNPLTATSTGKAEVRKRATRLVEDIGDGLGRLALVDADLLLALLGPELDRAVRRSLPEPVASAMSLVAASFGVTADPPPGRRRKRGRDSQDDSCCWAFGDCCDPCAGCEGGCCDVGACDACCTCGC